LVTEWVGTPGYINAGTTTFNYLLYANGPYDPDATGTHFGGTRTANVFSKLFSAEGPYRNYLVERWTVSLELANAAAGPVNVFMLFSSSASDGQTLAAMNNYNPLTTPDFCRTTLTAVSGSKSFGVLKNSGNLARLFGDPNDPTFAGAYNAQPSSFANCILYFDSTMTGTTNVQIYVVPRITFYMKAYSHDSSQ